MAAPNKIPVSQLLRLNGTPDCPIVVDVSIDADFSDDPYLIPGSFRHPHSDVAGLKARVAGRPCGVICQRGIKLSEGMAARLRADGLRAISVGLSRQYKDDQTQLEAGMAIYDALYRWARDGQGETHDWAEGHRS